MPSWRHSTLRHDNRRPHAENRPSARGNPAHRPAPQSWAYGSDDDAIGGGKGPSAWNATASRGKASRRSDRIHITPCSQLFQGRSSIDIPRSKCSSRRRRSRKSSRPEGGVSGPPRANRSANPCLRGPRCRSEAHRASTGSPWRRKAFRGFADSLGAPRRPICRA